MEIAQTWIDDPDGTYERTIEHLERNFREGVISGAECGMARGVAQKCRDQGRAQS